MSQPGFYSTPPSDGSTLVEAANWAASLLTGSVGTIVAILAVATVGFAMLLGRVSVRDGARVVIGCFILFGAPLIGRELLGLARWNSGPVSVEGQPASPAPIVIPTPPPRNRDPYAGASVPL